MNHLKTGTAFFRQGSYKNNKYNSKELQETGMYSYGWRDYMPDIARWNGIDQLAENYLSTSTYVYVANNPVSYADVDGRWFNEDGTINTSGYTPGFTTGRQYQQSFLGQYPGQGGGGNYTPFGDTKAYSILMNAFQNGGAGGLKNQNGYLSYWTSSPGFFTIDENGEKEYNIGLMTNYRGKLEDTSIGAYKNWADWGATTMEGGFKYVADRRTTLYNSGYWIDNFGQMRSTTYAGRAADSQIGLRSSYLRNTVMFGKFAKGAGYVGLAINAGQIGYGVYKDGWEIGVRTKVATAGVTGGLAGAAAGAWALGKVGAGIGSFIGPEGTAIGGVIGGIIGGIVGGYYGGEYAEGLTSDFLNKPDYIKQ